MRMRHTFGIAKVEMVSGKAFSCEAAATIVFFLDYSSLIFLYVAVLLQMNQTKVVVQGQLTLDALPDLLFVNNSGVHKVELGTVIRARCTASSSSAPLLTWFKDGASLANDPPHIRIRSSSRGSQVTSVLTIDNFTSTDDGDYYCETSDDTDTLTSTTLSLSVVDDDTIALIRNPVDYEIRGGVSDHLKTYDTIHDNRSSYSLGSNFEPTTPVDYTDTCCRVFRCNAAIPGDQTAATNITLFTVTWLRNEEEVVNSGRTEIVNDLRYNAGNSETRLISELRLLPFETSDIGVYQCVYSDFDNDRELVFSTPFSLDTDNSADVMLEAVSPEDIILDPPEKLVIEVESSGGYHRHAWYRNDEELYPNGDTNFRQANPARFSEFFQVFVQDPTTTSDHGIYRVELIYEDDISPTVYQTLNFSVTPPVSLSVEALNTTTVTVLEGGDVDISCIARANPLPSNITWSFGGSSTSFTQTDSIETRTASVPSAGTFAFTEGNTTSTLHITAAQYPTHSGTYTCSSSNDTTTTTDTILVDVQVALIAGSDGKVTFSVGEDLVLMAVFSDFNLELDGIEWTQNSSISLVDGVDGVRVTNTGLSPPRANSILTRPGITGVSYGGTYTATATNPAGSASTTFTVEIIATMMIAKFQVRLVGISECLQWKEIELNEKKEAVITSITRGVNELCQCDFSRDSFHEIDITAGFQCFAASPTAVTFRAEIMDTNVSELIVYIEEWVASQPTIVVLSSRLSIDSDCEVQIGSFSEPECGDTDREIASNTNIDANNIGYILGGVFVFLIALLIVALLLVLLCVRNRAKVPSTVKEEDSPIYEPMPGTPAVSQKLTNLSAVNQLSGQGSISTGGNPSYAIHVAAQDKPVGDQPFAARRHTSPDPQPPKLWETAISTFNRRNTATGRS